MSRGAVDTGYGSVKCSVSLTNRFHLYTFYWHSTWPQIVTTSTEGGKGGAEDHLKPIIHLTSVWRIGSLIVFPHSLDAFSLFFSTVQSPCQLRLELSTLECATTAAEISTSPKPQCQWQLLSIATTHINSCNAHYMQETNKEMQQINSAIEVPGI